MRNTNGNGSKARPGLWSRMWRNPYPTVGCEISTSGVSAARWHSRGLALASSAWRPLPSGAVEASPLRENLRQVDAVRQCLAAAFEAVGVTPGARPTDAVIIIPDQAARLFVLNFDDLPSSEAEAIPVVKLRLKKSVPFDIESAVVSYFAERAGAQWQVVAAVAPEEITRAYESVVESLGLRPRWVTLSTLASLALSRDGGSADGSAAEASDSQAPPGVLIAKYSPPWLTTVVLQGDYLRLFRTTGIGNEGGVESEPDEPAAHAVLETIYPSVAYFQDNYGGRLSRVYLCGLGTRSAAIAEALERELRLPAVSLTGGARHISSDDDASSERHFASLLGILREQHDA